MDLVSLLSAVPGWALYGAAASTICAAMATVLPPPKLPASGWYPLFYGLVNHLALNVGKATNVGAPHR